MSNGIDRVLRSSLIKKKVPYRVVLPGDYADTMVSYPVLYLLHGLFGSYENWTEFTDIETYAGERRLIIVMPDGGDGWYTDSVDKNERYLIDELLPEIERNFRTIPEKGYRAIAGNSMGGYGAFKFALKNPATFSFAASFSGAFNVTDLCKESPGRDWKELGPSITHVFGEKGSNVRRENSLEDLAAQSSDRLPYFYFDCGSDDIFVHANRDLARIFAKLGIDFEFYEFEGGHDWTYWDGRIRHILRLASEKFESSGTA